MRGQHSDVLVVGAGPVGMFAALLLAREGIKVQIIDEGSGPAGHSYACGLHSRTLSMLRDVGIHAQLVRAGRRVDRLAFYEGASRHAEIDFGKITQDLPFMLVVPQDELESALQQALEREHHVPVRWNHRLTDLAPSGDGVTATMNELSGTATGYDVPKWETVVRRTFDVSAQYVLGCDGQRSGVRTAAGIESDVFGSPELFVVYEFDADADMPDEIRVVLNPGETNVLWPMRENRYRWSFQWTATEPDGEFPPKERSHLWFEEKPVAQRTEAHLENLIKQRAPWFSGKIENMDWTTDVQFQRRLVRQFGSGRCWLAGDAAHQTGPVGVQSLNVGMREAAAFVQHIKPALGESGTLTPMAQYDEVFREEWQRLLGVTTELEVADRSRACPLKNRAALLSCLPASGNELEQMLHCLGLRLKTFSAPTAQRR